MFFSTISPSVLCSKIHQCCAFIFTTARQLLNADTAHLCSWLLGGTWVVSNLELIEQGYPRHCQTCLWIPLCRRFSWGISPTAQWLGSRAHSSVLLKLDSLKCQMFKPQMALPITLPPTVYENPSCSSPWCHHLKCL